MARVSDKNIQHGRVRRTISETQASTKRHQQHVWKDSITFPSVYTCLSSKKNKNNHASGASLTSWRQNIRVHCEACKADRYSGSPIGYVVLHDGRWLIVYMIQNTSCCQCCTATTLRTFNDQIPPTKAAFEDQNHSCFSPKMWENHGKAYRVKQQGNYLNFRISQSVGVSKLFLDLSWFIKFSGNFYADHWILGGTVF